MYWQQQAVSTWNNKHKNTQTIICDKYINCAIYEIKRGKTNGILFHIYVHTKEHKKYINTREKETRKKCFCAVTGEF